MMSKTTYVASLYVMAFSCIATGAIGLYKRYDFSQNFIEARMKLSPQEKTQTKKSAINPADHIPLNIIYVTKSESVPVTRKYVYGTTANILLDGGEVPVRYSRDNPKLAYEYDTKPDSGMLWWVVGIVLIIPAVIGHRLLKISR